MAEGLQTPPLTQLEFTPPDHRIAERIARALGYEQYVYTSTSALWGLFCLPENPANRPPHHSEQRTDYPPYVHGCIIKTREFGFMFVQTCEDLRLDNKGRRRS
jgi:hypothetical protein